MSDISEQLICQCGCLIVLATCTCTLPNGAQAMTALIEQKLAQGQSGKQILDFFAAEYGEQVLASPPNGEQVLASPPNGDFNLVAWVLSFVAILGGGVVIYFALKKWVGRGRRSQISARTRGRG